MLVFTHQNISGSKITMDIVVRTDIIHSTGNMCTHVKQQNECISFPASNMFMKCNALSVYHMLTILTNSAVFLQLVVHYITSFSILTI